MISPKKMTGGGSAIRTLFSRFIRDERGATAIEYSLIVALIFLAILGGVRQFSSNTSEMYSTISSALPN